MTAFTITVDDAAVQAVLHKLASRAGGLAPVLQVVGEGMIERTKRRYAGPRLVRAYDWPSAKGQ